MKAKPEQIIGGECDGDCPFCDPESYTTTVDAGFLRNVKDMYDTLERIKEDYYTTKYWGQEIDMKLKSLSKLTKHPLKFNQRAR